LRWRRPPCTTAIGRCRNAVESGRTALLEVMTHEEPELALGAQA